MKKTKRGRKPVAPPLPLPPPPSTTIVKWDASLSADDYYQEASKAIAQSEARLEWFRKLSLPDEWNKVEIFNCKMAQSLLWEAKYQLLENSPGLAQLLDRNNWASTRPSLSVFAALDIQGTLKIVWKSRRPLRLVPAGLLLENTTGFKDQFFRECFFNTQAYGNTRPAAELMRFRSVPLTWHNDRDHHPAVRYIIYAIHSRYQQILRDVGHEIKVVEATRFEFLQDNHNQVEWTFA